MNHKKIVENWIIVDTILKRNMGTISDSVVDELLNRKLDLVDKIIKRGLGTIEDSGKNIKPRPYTKEKRNNNKNVIKRCELKDKRCDFKDYSDLKDCADRLKVKCRVIDYSPLSKSYMEIY